MFSPLEELKSFRDFEMDFHYLKNNLNYYENFCDLWTIGECHLHEDPVGTFLKMNLTLKNLLRGGDEWDLLYFCIRTNAMTIFRC